MQNKREKNVVVSIIMSVYNERLHWIKQSIDSILNQTLSDYEFVIVNDNPQSVEIDNLLNKYRDIDSRIKIIKNDVNIGLTKSLNKALSICKGKYIARMDADDISFSHRLMIQYDYLEKNNSIDVCGTNRIIINEMGKKLKKISPLVKSPNQVKSVFVLRSPLVHPSVMFRRSIIENNIKYDESFLCSQDYNLWGTLLKKNYNIANIDKSLLYYRISSSQLSVQRNSIQVKNAILIKRSFATHYGIVLNDNDYELLTLPYSIKKQEISTTTINNLINVLSRISSGLKRYDWFDEKKYNIEASRIIIILCLRSRHRLRSLKELIKSRFGTSTTIIHNILYFLSRI